MELKDTAVMIVDDDADNIEILSSMLEEEGYTTLSAMSGAEALRILSATDENIKIILLDIRMPGISGTDVLKGLKANERFRNIKIILQTSLDRPMDIAQGTENGADRYLTKPLDKNVVISTVNSCVKEFDELQTITDISHELNERVTLLEDFLRILEEQSDNPSPFELISRLRVHMRNVMKIPGDPEVVLLKDHDRKGVFRDSDQMEICYPPFSIIIKDQITEFKENNVLQMLAIMSKHIQIKTQEAINRKLEKKLKNTIDTAGQGTLELIKEIDETGNEMTKELILQKMKINLMEILVAASHDHLKPELERLKMGILPGDEGAETQSSVDDLLEKFGM